jgi:plasmid maintenance system killer protein
MRVIFKESALARIDSELTFTGGYPLGVARAYRGRIQVLRAAPQEHAIQPLKSLRLQSCGNGQHSMRVTDDWDLIVAFEDSEDGRVAVLEAMIENKERAHDR